VSANRTGIAHPFSSATLAAVCLSRFLTERHDRTDQLVVGL
jgi:hypothetical protein